MKTMFLQFGPLGVVFYILYWIVLVVALLFLTLYVLVKIWPVTLTALALVVALVVWRQGRKRRKRG